MILVELFKLLSESSAKIHHNCWKIFHLALQNLIEVDVILFIPLCLGMIGYFFISYMIADSQGRNSPSYSLQQYPTEIPSTSFNSYYNTQFPHLSSSSANTCIYNYNYTNSGHTYVSNSKSFGTTHHSAYVTNSRNSVLHNATSAQYTSSQHSPSYMNSHYTNANYQQSLPNQSQTSAPQSIIFPELNNLTNEELKRLSEDEDKLDDFLEKHSQIKDINVAVEDAMDWVEKTAGKKYFYYWNIKII